MRHDSDQIPTGERTFQNCTSGRPEIPDATRFLRLLISLLSSNPQKRDQSMSTYGNLRPIGDPIGMVWCDGNLTLMNLFDTKFSWQTNSKKLLETSSKPGKWT